ncbi:MAG: beta-xylosidase, partial [Verrucomicrobia bacterium]
LKRAPIVIGECDPEGCAACQGSQLGYRNGTMYSSYTAASFARIYDLADRRGVNLDAALTWAFTFEDQPPFAGFRQLASCGIDLPVLNVFRMFSRMNGQRIAVESDSAVPLEAMLKSGVREWADVSALASFDGNKLCVLAWHYHDDDLPGEESVVALELAGVKADKARLTRYAIDAEHSDAFTAWQKMGSPAQPTPAQFAELEKAGQLAAVGSPELVAVTDGAMKFNFRLSRQAVTLLVFELAR